MSNYVVLVIILLDLKVVYYYVMFGIFNDIIIFKFYVILFIGYRITYHGKTYNCVIPFTQNYD